MYRTALDNFGTSMAKVVFAVSASLSEEQIVQMVKRLPLKRKREIAALIEQELAEERRRKQTTFRTVLLQIAEESGADWSQLTPEQQAQFILSNYHRLLSAADVIWSAQQQTEPIIREAARQAGYDWDTMSEDDRSAFVAEWIED